MLDADAGMRNSLSKFALSLTLAFLTCVASTPGGVAALVSATQSESEYSEQFEEKEFSSQKSEDRAIRRKQIILRQFSLGLRARPRLAHHHTPRHSEPSCYRYFSPLLLRAPPQA